MISKDSPNRNDDWIALIPNQSRKHRFKLMRSLLLGKPAVTRQALPTCLLRQQALYLSLPEITAESSLRKAPLKINF